jgi:NAD(P)-dependent dehydrogenase (short-subunit alcohol dehydrogenase family)
VGQGARVVIHGRNEHEGQRVVADLVAGGARREHLAFRRADLADESQCRELIDYVSGVFGGLDVLVNNAGDTSRGYIEDTTVEQWDRQMAVNVRAPFILTQAAIPPMLARGGGSIVNIGSVNAYIGQAKLMSYSVSKGALMTFTKNAAARLNRYHIRANLLNVGWTLTLGEDRVMREDTGREDWLTAALATRPFGRMLLPRDIALAALYFASDDSALITGAVVDLEQYPITPPPL